MFEEFVTRLSDFVWGPPSILLLIGTGILLSFRTGLIQLKKFGLGLKIIRGDYDDPGIAGDVSHYQALSTALAATIGTGNIVGVATAIAVGGPGAVFWMWITALVGMATKYSCCLLALRYRTTDPSGHISGGPMYYLERGLGLKALGRLFALCTVAAALGIGNLVQSHSAADYLHNTFSIPQGVTSVALAVLVGLVIIGGIRRIAHVASFLVPFMCAFYTLACLVVLVLNISKIPEALGLIFKHAFTPLGATGGFLGSSVLLTMRMGVARGIFSNEAGLGSAPIAHAAAKTKEPVREGLVAMMGPFIDTILVCTLTALVIITTGVWREGLDGATLSAQAFHRGLGIWGERGVALSLLLFVYTTIIGWFYYGDRALYYLTGPRYATAYKWLWTSLVAVGAVVQLKTVWNLADIANGFMAFPNLVGLIGLSGVVSKSTRDYFERVKRVTPLVGTHERLGGRMTDFHGWYLPLQYSGILEEHRAVRQVAGLFDASHLAKIHITGEDAHSFVQKLVVSDLSRMGRGDILYTLITNEKGGVLDDILVYMHSHRHYFLVTNAVQSAKVIPWLQKHRFPNTQIRDATQALGMLALQGPRAVEFLEPYLKASYKRLKLYTFEQGTFQNKIPVLVSRTGYTGEDGFELIPPAGKSAWVWNTLSNTLLSDGTPLVPCGLGARDTLRLEAGNLLSGQDFDERNNPFEIGLGKLVHFEKPYFLGRPALARLHAREPRTRLAAFTLKGRAIPRSGNPVFGAGARAGEVTSGSFAPTLGYTIGLAHIDSSFSAPGTEIEIETRGQRFPGVVTSKPFYRRRALTSLKGAH
ncbi:MAG: glycine cleavage system aminomethyltransferase GcvT [Candidatus Omnitrophica bacterium]|nr:glycine cleavage system aminomethyltransferase GcvT [Candidatus Omnitrophota bacterium]